MRMTIVVLGGMDPSAGIMVHTDTTATIHNHKQLSMCAFSGFFKLVQHLSPQARWNCLTDNFISDPFHSGNFKKNSIQIITTFSYQKK